ncbi:MAG: cation-translocating P-type ATPase [Patescibacteria group bacterium]
MSMQETDLKGLSTQEAQKRLKEYGPNLLPENPPPSGLVIFLSQLKSPLVYILIVAAVITWWLGDHEDTYIILIAVLLNTVLGFYQEKRAGEALEALKRMLHPQANVIRNGEQVTIPVGEIVPGDLVVINQGDKISADGELVEANRLYLTEAILTGESVPVTKEMGDIVYMGTVASGGRGLMKVSVTGEHTEMGKIAISVQELKESTPLKRQLEKFSKQLTYVVLGLSVLVFITGILFGNSPAQIFTTSVALAVSAIPEGLLVALTVVLAIGMQRILKRKGLVRNLVSAETLGGVTCICVDKTGTLTKGSMSVVDIIGDEDILALQVLVANDLDDPIVIAAAEWGKSKLVDTGEITSKYKRLDSLPFNSDNMFFASLNDFDNESNLIFVNGAPEKLINLSTLSHEEKDSYRQKVESLSAQGKRVIGFAQKRENNSKTGLEINDITSGNLTFIGMLAFSDPVREDVSNALQKAMDAGIRIFVITGDYSKTAMAVMQQLGLHISDDNIVLGSELRNMSNTQIDAEVSDGDKIKLFARTTPDQKLKIIESLKRTGEVVAMTGDGVNDAPAVSKADIGIVVGEASDVAKESADLVLLDSSFSTIIAAIEEGRGIFDNIRKIILYLMSDAFQAILTILLALLFLPVLPVTASQILWVNLISDGFPSLALTIDPKSKGIMQKPPRSPKELLVAKWMTKLIALVSVVGGVFAFLIFWYVYTTSQDLLLAQSVTFVSLGINSLIYVFSVRTLSQPFWKESLFGNKWLVLAVIGGALLQFVPFSTAATREFFGLVPIGTYWFVALGMAFLLFAVIELSTHFLFTEEK